MKQGKVTIGICDDEKFFVNQIQFACEDYLEEVCNEIEFVKFRSGEELIAYQGDMLDLLFLDIELGGMNGIEVMNQIVHSPYVWRIVFVSTHDELVWDTFGIKTLGFCRKPVDSLEISKYLKCALFELNKDVVISFKKYDEDTCVRLSDILYIEGRASYIEVYTKEKSFIVTGKIGEWEKKLVDTTMIRIHKSILVNMQYMTLEGMRVILSESGEEFVVGRTYKNKVEEKYTQFIMERMRKRT